MTGEKSDRTLIPMPRVLAERMKELAGPGGTYASWVNTHLACERTIAELRETVALQRELIATLRKKN